MAAILAHTATAGDFCFGRMFLCLFVRLRENFQNIGRLWLKGSRLLLTLDQNSQIIIPNFLLGGVFRHAGFHSSPHVDCLLAATSTLPSSLNITLSQKPITGRCNFPRHQATLFLLFGRRSPIALRITLRWYPSVRRARCRVRLDTLQARPWLNFFVISCNGAFLDFLTSLNSTHWHSSDITC